MGQRVTELIVPGLFDSGPDHWQSLWCQARLASRRVDLGQWDHPSRALWVSRLDRAIAREKAPILLVAHSLGCHAVAWWVAEASVARLEKVIGALLVAPPDVDRHDVHPLLLPFAPTPIARLPFRSLLVASHDDGYARFDRSAWMARQWGCELIDAGRKGHINADSGLGDWPEGQRLLDELQGLRAPTRSAVSPSSYPGEAPFPDTPRSLER